MPSADSGTAFSETANNERILFTSESVGEGHPGMTEIISMGLMPMKGAMQKLLLKASFLFKRHEADLGMLLLSSCQLIVA